MLMIIDLHMLGIAFPSIPASKIASALDRPMMIGFVVMVVSGLLLYFAIPVRTTQSIWFRLKVVLLIAAAINAWLFRRRMQELDGSQQTKLPLRLRVGAGLSLGLWAGIVAFGRAIAYDWFDCTKPLGELMFWAAGCVEDA